MTHEALWRAYFSAADKAAPTDALIAAYRTWVIRLARELRRGLPETVRMDDLVTDGTSAMWRAIGRYGGFDRAGADFTTFARRAVTGAMIDGMRGRDHLPRPMRKEKKQPKLLELGYASKRAADTSSGGGDPQRAIADADAFDRMLRWLPRREREVVSLVFRDGMKVVEAARVIGVTPTRVTQIKGDALRELRNRLAS